MSRQAETSANGHTRYGGPALLVAVLLLSILLTSCGGGTSKDGVASAPMHQTISFPIRHETHEDIVAAVEACREGVGLATWLPMRSKTELYEVCDKGLNRGLTEVRQYGEQVCGEVAFTVPSSNRAWKQRILGACEAKTKPFAPAVP